MTILTADFYPTPEAVAATMLDQVDLRGRVVVEPSAGSGNLVRECLARGAAEVWPLLRGGLQWLEFGDEPNKNTDPEPS